MKTYSTSEIANILGVHPNTVMLYEKWGYIAPVERKKNGYRVYTEIHLKQMNIVRIALSSEMIKCYMRLEMREVIKSVGKWELEKALKLCKEHLAHLQKEKENEIEVIKLIQEILKEPMGEAGICLNRNKAAKLIGVSITTIINWERNGLIEVPRNEKNHYRVYREKEIRTLKIIKVLRRYNYSSQCICNMVKKLESKSGTYINEENKNSPTKEEREKTSGELLSSLAEVEHNTKLIISRISKLIDISKL
jgi:DNA-binding transcriptional MerR regulator